MVRWLLPVLMLPACVSAAWASPATDEAERMIAQRDPAQDQAAFRRLEASARIGDMDAVALLGWLYDAGRGVERDLERAAELYRRAARDGNPRAQWRLGVMHDLGQGVPENPTEAVRLLRQSAQQDDAYGNASLAVMYANGRGVPTDYAQAMRYYRRAAELGAAAGFLGVGMLYADGLGVARQPREAAAWLLAAHAMSDPRARQLIGVLNLQPAEMQQASERANQLLQSFRRRERVQVPGR